MQFPEQSPDAKPAAAVTRILTRLKNGDAGASDELLDLVYNELRGLARAVFSNRSSAKTLQPTALVHEAWIKLAKNLDPIEDRGHFFVIAGRAMRQVITDHARARACEKRGAAARQITLDESFASRESNTSIDLMDLDESLRRLATLNERHAQVAEMRILSGLSIAETAQALGLSRRSVDSDWAMAKAWLREALAEEH